MLYFGHAIPFTSHQCSTSPSLLTGTSSFSSLFRQASTLVGFKIEEKLNNMSGRIGTGAIGSASEWVAENVHRWQDRPVMQSSRPYMIPDNGIDSCRSSVYGNSSGEPWNEAHGDFNPFVKEHLRARMGRTGGNYGGRAEGTTMNTRASHDPRLNSGMNFDTINSAFDPQTSYDYTSSTIDRQDEEIRVGPVTTRAIIVVEITKPSPTAQTWVTHCPPRVNVQRVVWDDGSGGLGDVQIIDESIRKGRKMIEDTKIWNARMNEQNVERQHEKPSGVGFDGMRRPLPLVSASSGFVFDGGESYQRSSISVPTQTNTTVPIIGRPDALQRIENQGPRTIARQRSGGWRSSHLIPAYQQKTQIKPRKRLASLPRISVGKRSRNIKSIPLEGKLVASRKEPEDRTGRNTKADGISEAGQSTDIVSKFFQQAVVAERGMVISTRDTVRIDEREIDSSRRLSFAAETELLRNNSRAPFNRN